VRSISYDLRFYDPLLGPPWRKAFEQAGRPEGVVSAEEGYTIATLHQSILNDEMRRICAPFTSADLFFAVRIWTPGLLDRLDLSFGEEDPVVGSQRPTMVMRRIAAAAALMYGRPFPYAQSTIMGGMVLSSDFVRFGRTFVALMTFTHAYFFSGWGLKMFCSMGYCLRVSESGLQLLDEDEEEQDILTCSNDNRRGGLNYNLLSRMGEFDEHPSPVFEPYGEVGKHELGEQSAIISAWYERDAWRAPGYMRNACDRSRTS
jgi:hypothetical protein